MKNYGIYCNHNFFISLHKFTLDKLDTYDKIIIGDD